MKSRKEWYRSRYTILAAALLITLLGAYHFGMETEKIVEERSAGQIEKSAHVFQMYLEDYIEEHCMALEKTASLLEGDILSDMESVKEDLKERQQEFVFYTVLAPDGERKYDSEDVSVEFHLKNERNLDIVVKEKKTLIFRNAIYDAERVAYMVFCTPVIRDGRVEAVLAGFVHLTDLSELLQRWETIQGGCAFLMTERGAYLTGSEQFDKMLGAQARDFLTYIDHCSIKSASLKGDGIYQAIQKKEEILLPYSYEGDSYVVNLFPLEFGEWYIGYLNEGKNFQLSLFKFRIPSFILVCAAVIAWCLMLCYTITLLYKFGSEKEQKQRYETIGKLDKAILMELNFAPKKLSFFGDVKQIFQADATILRGEEVYEIYNRVHPEDISIRKRLHSFFEDKEEVFISEVRLETEKGLYGWFRIKGMLIKDSYTGMNQKFIAKIESADEEIADEKNLVERAENDLLTGVLNKKTMEERVVQSLKEISGSSYRIFFMVDLDNFKNVNDKLGHIMGDRAIIDTAARLSEIFHRDAYVGRLGGDEFAVCVSYVAFDEESLYKFITKKAEKICEVNRRTYVNGDMAVNISSSVGIAIAPDMATEFEDLYKKADSALYQSKNGGKNCYHIYGRE